VRIESVETIRLGHPLTRPTGPASVLNRDLNLLLVRIETSDGVVGPNAPGLGIELDQGAIERLRV
jgi:L-alanine-DL-glutamate epimerase-like enolase superfamily enzyme